MGSSIKINIQNALIVTWFIEKTVNCKPTTGNGSRHVTVYSYRFTVEKTVAWFIEKTVNGEPTIVNLRT